MKITPIISPLFLFVIFFFPMKASETQHPRDVLVQLFQTPNGSDFILSEKDVCNVAQVCKKWNAAAMDVRIWKPRALLYFPLDLAFIECLSQHSQAFKQQMDWLSRQSHDNKNVGCWQGFILKVKNMFSFGHMPPEGNIWLYKYTMQYRFTIKRQILDAAYAATDVASPDKRLLVLSENLGDSSLMRKYLNQLETECLTHGQEQNFLDTLRELSDMGSQTSKTILDNYTVTAS